MKDFRQRIKIFLGQAVIASLAMSQIVIFAPSVGAASNLVVISQFQVLGDGGSEDEFIELYNTTASSVDISLWSIQYLSGGAAGYGTISKKNIGAAAGTVVISPYSYYLIAHSGAEYNGVAVADLAHASFAMSSASAGATLFLVDAQTNLGSGLDATIVDKAGYGSGAAVSPEGPTPLSVPGLELSWKRAPNDATGNGVDTNTNTADFISPPTLSTPHNSTSNPRPLPPPTGLTLTSADAQISASWTGVSSATHFEFGARASGDAFPADTRVPASVLTNVFTGLTNATTYEIRVRAVRLSGGMPDENSAYVTQSATPQATIIATPDELQANATYRMKGVSGIAFGQGTISVELSSVNGTNQGETLTSVTLVRPNSEVVIIPLVFNASTNSYTTLYDFVAFKSNGSQDGVVSVGVVTSQNRSVVLAIGTSSFTLDTQVNPPLLTLNARCPSSEDSFIGTVDADTVSVSIYRHSSLLPTYLVAVAPTTNSAMNEVFIGDNFFTSLYLVAKDVHGNVSATTTLTNDFLAPAAPILDVTYGNTTLTASWGAVSGATSYRLQWRQAGGDWNQVVTTDVMKSISVQNGTGHEVAVSALDGACNESAASISQGTPRFTFAVVGLETAAVHESKILEASIQVDAPKDGDPSASGQDDSASKASSDEDSRQDSTSVKDRSNLIVTVAIILIIAGIAIAAYSWYQGDGTPRESKPAPDQKKETTESVQPTTKKRGRPRKKKTRW